MPERSDVVVVNVRDTDIDEPIIWSPLPHLTHEDSTRRRVRLKGYINPPVGEARFELHPNYTLPSGWRLRENGNLLYNAILGQTIQLRFNATRGSESGYSDVLRITRQQAFIERLVPDRVVLGLGFNNATQRVYVYNTNLDSPVQDYISVFDINGVEQLSESLSLDSSVAGDIVPDRSQGFCFDGSHFWLVGDYTTSSGGQLHKLNTDGTVADRYTYTGGTIESLTFDGTSIWGLDIGAFPGLRKFSTAGVEDTAARIRFPSSFGGFQDAQHGLTHGDNHFWLIYPYVGDPTIRCLDSEGNRVTSRDITIESSGAGLTYNPTTDNLWWIYDRTDDEGSRYGVLEAQQI